MKKISYLLLLATLLIGGATTSHACTPSLSVNIPTIPNISASAKVPEVEIEDKYIPKTNAESGMWKEPIEWHFTFNPEWLKEIIKR